MEGREKMRESRKSLIVGAAAGGVAGSLLIFALVALMIFAASLISGCGDAREPGDTTGLSVVIHCDAPAEGNRCFVLVHGATDVEAFYGDRLAWWDLDISNPEDRQTYVDSPPRGAFTVSACNEIDCHVVREDLP